MKEKMIVFETKYWLVGLADNQQYLGRCYIDIKSDAGRLSDLTPEEWQDLHENVIAKLEPAIRKAFGAEMFNWSCLMNNAYKPEIKEPQPHVHFHMLPRYRHPVEFAGEGFQDTGFGVRQDPEAERLVSEEVYHAIISKIKECLD